MALITCEECGKEISDVAKTCPYCGYPMFDIWAGKEDKKLRKRGCIVYAIFLAFALMMMISGISQLSK